MPETYIVKVTESPDNCCNLCKAGSDAPTLPNGYGIKA